MRCFWIIISKLIISRDTEDNSTVITRAGFQFLLLSTGQQVWLFLLHYLHTAGQRGLDPAQCLAFLFQLSFSTLGKVQATPIISLREIYFQMITNLISFLQMHEASSYFNPFLPQPFIKQNTIR